MEPGQSMENWVAQSRSHVPWDTDSLVERLVELAGGGQVFHPPTEGEIAEEVAGDDRAGRSGDDGPPGPLGGDSVRRRCKRLHHGSLTLVRGQPDGAT